MFTLYILLTLITCAVEFLNVKIVQEALESMEKNEDEEGLQKIKNAAILIFILIVSQISLAVLREQNDFIITLINERVKHGINGLIFEKSLRSRSKETLPIRWERSPTSLRSILKEFQMLEKSLTEAWFPLYK